MQLIDKQIPHAIELRHRLHQIPELSYKEFKTAALIREELDRLGIAYTKGVHEAPTATIALIGDSNKPCIALRADIDALPIIEKTNLPYASCHPGCMHACGHDGHTAILLATAALLQEIQHTLPVCVKLLWQPAEEGGAGAEKLVQAGVLDNVEAVFGLHGWPGLAVGTVATKSGTLLAAVNNFKATFVGKGCHGAFPHIGVDPIVAASEAVLNLQAAVSREVDPTDSVVITVGVFQAGTEVNIIPNSATISGTLRTLNEPSRKKMLAIIKRRLEGIAHANNCSLELELSAGYPATINDPKMTDYVADVAKKLFGEERWLTFDKPVMAGEDFAYYLEKVPGSFFLLGVQPDPSKPYPPLHNDTYDFTDAAIKTGIQMFVEIVRQYR